jgi:phage shock protein PspC (stress-responsive transcriptional regulator)
MMETQQDQVALPMRSHTIFGVCEGLGEDFGFNPVFLRVPLAASVLWSPALSVAIYFALGAVVLVSRLLFPRSKPTVVQSEAPALNPANEQHQMAKAA